MGVEVIKRAAAEAQKLADTWAYEKDDKPLVMQVQTPPIYKIEMVCVNKRLGKERMAAFVSIIKQVMEKHGGTVSSE